MPHFPEANEAPFDTLEAQSRTRPPQRNETVCGCRCGCGCSGALEGDGESQDDDRESVHTLKTLVGSNISDADEYGFPPSSDGVEDHAVTDAFIDRWGELWYDGSGRQVQTRFAGYVNDGEGFQLSEGAGMQGSPTHLHQLPQAHGVQEMSDSMRIEMASDDRSTTKSDVVSVRCISPGPGVGAWVEDVRITDYHFLKRPLRLTPQRRFCRGLVASHLVLQDDTLSIDAEGTLFSDIQPTTGVFFR